MSRKSKVESLETGADDGHDFLMSSPMTSALVCEPPSSYGFEHLSVWQKARLLAKTTYDLTSSGPVSKDWALQGQMRRAALSIVPNLAEGAERKSQREFAQFVSVAKASSAELRAQVIVCHDVGFFNDEQHLEMKRQAEVVSRMLGGLLAAIQAGKTGSKA